MIEKLPTHVAYGLRRESRLRSRYLEIGHGTSDMARCPNCHHEFPYSGLHHALLDRMPTGAFTWRVTFSPNGVKPPDPEPQPERPEDTDSA